MPYIPQDVLRRYLDERLITEQRHPLDENLQIINYTHACQHGNIWDAVTTQCRGLIQDVKHEKVIARPFAKFFNVSEHISKGLSLPNELPIVTAKEDGSLGILYWLNGQRWIATRGSFTSPHAQWATKWLRENRVFISQPAQDVLRDDSVTHLFEIIAPVSALVVKYDFEGLIHLATLDKATGRDVWPLSKLPRIDAARVIDAGACDLEELQRRNLDNEEGYVALFPECGLRLKVKFQWYTDRHRLITGLSAHALWEMWRDGQTLDDVLQDIPEEMHPWIIQQYGTFATSIKQITVEARDTYYDIMAHQLSRSWGKNKTARDKEIALRIQEHGAMAPLMFQMHKQSDMLWKAVEPSGSETFRREGEE